MAKILIVSDSCLAAGMDNKQQLKFPFVACEVFCCEVDAVLDALLESERHLGHLFSLLAGPPPLNSVLVGYFARILTALLIKRPQVCCSRQADLTFACTQTRHRLCLLAGPRLLTSVFVGFLVHNLTALLIKRPQVCA